VKIRAVLLSLEILTAIPVLSEHFKRIFRRELIDLNVAVNKQKEIIK
jgi:hypothetical protein